MKKLLSLFSLTILGAALLSTWSCQKDPNPNADPSATVTKLAGGDPAFPSTSASFDVATTAMESYVYVVVPGENIPSPNPVVLYAEATEVYKLTDGTTKVNIYGLEGSEKYTVHFAFKHAGKNQYISRSVSTATPEYSRLINVIKADRLEFTVQFNAPDTMHYRYLIVELSQYAMRSDGGMGDVDMLTHGGTRAKGPQVITTTDGIYEFPVKPGTGFVVMFAETDTLGNISVTPISFPQGAATSKVSPIKPNESYYSEKTLNDFYTFDDKFAFARLYTAPPKVGEGLFTITPNITEINASFHVKPPASLKRYGAVIVSDVAWKTELIPAVGEDGALNYVLLNWTKELVGEQVIYSNEVLQKDSLYKLILIGVCDDTGETQVQNVYDFKPIVSDKPAIDLTVTPIKDANNNPYMVHFNIKAPNKDLVNAKFLMGYVKDWLRTISKEYTYEIMLNNVTNAENIFTVDQISLINSDAGLTLDFPSLENIENRLVVGSYNIHDKLKVFTADIRSLEEPAKPPVQSPLFEDLIGKWKLTYKYKTSIAATKFTTATIDVEFTKGPEDIPATFVKGDAKYDAVFRFFVAEGITKGAPDPEAYATAKIAEQIIDYKKSVEQYTKKYRDQNRVVMRNFNYVRYSGLEYKSPFDLFSNVNYSAYDNDQLMYEYGPKMFFEISKDENSNDVIKVQTDPTFIAPLSGHHFQWQIYIAGTTAEGINFTEFPVEMVDANTLKIKKSVEVNGAEHFFSVVTRTTNGVYRRISLAAEDIVINRITTKGPANLMAETHSNAQPTITPQYVGKQTGVSNIMRRTKIPTMTGVPANLEPVSSIDFNTTNAVKIPVITSILKK